MGSCPWPFFMKYLQYSLFICLTFLMGSCANSDEELAQVQIYDGPVQRAENITMYYSQSANVKVKLVAAVLKEFENGDRDFPEGLYMEFYDEEGAVTSTLRADEAYYFKEDDLWRGRGNVEIISLVDGQQLNTEELFWDPKAEEMYTSKFVTITEGDEVFHGTGLRAAQDFSWYGFGDPNGNFNLEE